MTEEQWHARISFITEGLWVSEISCRTFPEWLKCIGVDRVVSILTEEQKAEWDVRAPVIQTRKNSVKLGETVQDPTHRTYLYADGDYIEPANMNTIVESFGEVTLLHCISGANRSSAVAICRLLYLGWDPIEACHTYWTQRGRSTANVYGSVPRMAKRMLASVKDYHEWRQAR